MAQSGYTPILIYGSNVAGHTPLATNLTNSTLGSELAVNVADGKLFYKDSGGSVQVIAWKITPTTAGGTGQSSFTDGQLLIGNSTGNTLTKSTLTASPTITITNGSGAITIGTPSGIYTATADYTVAASIGYVINNKASALTLTLPAASTNTGRQLTVQNYQAQNVVSASSNVIPLGGGAAGTAILTNVASKWATLVSNGSNWVIMAAG